GLPVGPGPVPLAQFLDPGVGGPGPEHAPGRRAQHLARRLDVLGPQIEQIAVGGEAARARDAQHPVQVNRPDCHPPDPPAPPSTAAAINLPSAAGSISPHLCDVARTSCHSPKKRLNVPSYIVDTHGTLMEPPLDVATAANPDVLAFYRELPFNYRSGARDHAS